MIHGLHKIRLKYITQHYSSCVNDGSSGCINIFHIPFHLRVHGSENAMEDHSVVILCTVRYLGCLDVGQARHFVTKNTFTPAGSDRHKYKRTFSCYCMLCWPSKG
jgi:hypothetical protein